MVIIPDVHGRDFWKRVMNPITTYKGTFKGPFVFLGDWFDSHPDQADYVPRDQQLNNFREFVEWQEKTPNVVPLLGNHDLYYLMTKDFRDPQHPCSGISHDEWFVNSVHGLMKRVKWQVAYLDDNVLLSHAGVTNHWYKERFMSDYNAVIGNTEVSIDKQLNAAFKVGSIESLFDVGNRRGGWHKHGGPFWADRNDLFESTLPGYIQIVGHTARKYPEFHFRKDAGICFLDTAKCYYVDRIAAFNNVSVWQID